MFPPILPYPAVVPVLHFHGNNIVSTISTVNDRTLFGDTVIEEGDFLWCDFGIIAMGLWTDTQHLGYVPTLRNFLEQRLWGSNLGGGWSPHFSAVFNNIQMNIPFDSEQVLRRGETEPPAGLTDGVRKSNRMQDLVSRAK